MTASVSPAVAAAATHSQQSSQSSQSSEKTSHSAVGVNDSPSASCRRCVKVLRDLIDGLQDPSSAAITARANKTLSSSSSSSSTSTSTSKHRATTSITTTTTTEKEPAPLTLLKAIASLGHLNKEQLRVEVVDDGVKLHLPVERTLPESLSPWSKWLSGGVVGGLATTTGSSAPAENDDNDAAAAAAGGGIGGISGLLGSLPLALSVQLQQQQQQRELIIAQQGDASQSQSPSPSPPPPLIDPLTIELKCRKCASTGPEAGARAFLMGPTPLSVVVCHNRIQGHAQEVEEILTHELVHLYDVQTLHLDLQDCHNLAYSEIRAAKAAECRESWHPHLQKYCVKQKAICATNNLFPQQGRQCIQKVFDQAFADNRPFGRSSSASAGGSTAAAAPPSSS